MRKLDIFDFDGTLFRNPHDTPENRKKYEEKHGIPWLIDKELSRELSRKLRRAIPMRRGWYGRPETLEPPLVPDPAPLHMFIEGPCNDFRCSKTNPEVFTLILTGRHVGLKNHVLRILGDGGLVDVHRARAKTGESFYQNVDPEVTITFLGQDGPKPRGTKPSQTLPWKLWIIEQYIDANDDLETIEIWEDREEHVKEFDALNGAIEQNVIVHHVTDR